MSDSRWVIGAPVQTKATHLSSDAQCGRWFRSLWKSKFISGTVTNVIASQSQTGRQQTDLEVDWELPSGIVKKRVKLRNLKAHDTHQQGYQQSEPSVRNTIQVDTESESDDHQSVVSDLTVVHGYEWVKEEVPEDLGGPIARRPWYVHTNSGCVFCE